MEIIDRIGGFKFVQVLQHSWPTSFRIAKGPALLIAKWIDNCHADHVLETFQFSKDDCSTRPRTRERVEKMKTAGRRKIRCRAIIRDPFTKRVLLPLKFSGRGLLGW